MKSKKWLFVWSLALVSQVLSVLIFNYNIDAAGIFNSPIYSMNKFKKRHISENTSKYYIYNRNKNIYNCLLLGSSRMSVLETEQFDKILKKRCFNYGLGGSGIYEQIKTAKNLIENNSNIETIIIGLDFFGFNPYLIQNGSINLFNKKRYSNELYLEDFFEHLFSLRSLKNSVLTLEYNLKNNSLHENLANIKFDKQVENYRSNYSRYANPELKKISSISKGTSALKDFTVYLKNKNIDLVLFTSPIHNSLLEAIKENDIYHTYLYWKKEINSFHTIQYDFQSDSYFLNTRSLYLDPSHIEDIFTNEIVEKLVENGK